MDMSRITQKDIVRGYLCRISLGYRKDISGYLFQISLEDILKKDILNLQRYPEISFHIFTYP